MPFKDTKEGQTHFYGDNCGEPEHNTYKKCEECLANYCGEHECFGLMKMLVEFSKKKKHSRINR